jgi:hypothetical protein
LDNICAILSNHKFVSDTFKAKIKEATLKLSPPHASRVAPDPSKASIYHENNVWTFIVKELMNVISLHLGGLDQPLLPKSGAKVRSLAIKLRRHPC